MALDKKIFMFNVILVMGILLNSVYLSGIVIGDDGGGVIDEPTPGPDDPVIDDPRPDLVCESEHTRTCSNGPGECSYGLQICIGNEWGVCDAPMPGDFPEICNDGKDNDCDTKTDHTDEDCRCDEGAQRPCPIFEGLGLCADNYQLCGADGYWQPDCIGPLPGDLLEICDDSLDNDCDGLTDRSDLDCVEFCDGIDNDKDGEIDEDCPRMCISVYNEGDNDNKVDFCCTDFDDDGEESSFECLLTVQGNASNGEGGMEDFLILDPRYFRGGGLLRTRELCQENCFNDKDDDCDGLDDYSDPDCYFILGDPCTDQRDNDDDGVIDDCYCGEDYEDELPLWYAECLGSNGSPTGIDGDQGEDDCYAKGEWYCDCPLDTYNRDNKCIACADFEICNDSFDNDCDGFTDCEDPECFSKSYCGCKTGTTQECGLDIGACTKGTQRCSNNKWGECKNAILPVKEICDDFKDNDCDGKTDEGCTDEICNGIDDNLNGAVDEGCPCIYASTIDCGLDEGLCQFGYQICVGKVWSDCKEAIWPVKEICGDRLDNDCDGFKDEDCFTAGTNPNALKLEIIMDSKIEVKTIQEIKIINKKTRSPIEGVSILINTPSGLIETFTTGKEGNAFFRADELGIYKVEVTYQNIKLNSIFVSQNIISLSFDTIGSVGLFFFGNACTENSFICLLMVILSFVASLLAYYVAGNYLTDTKTNLSRKLTSAFIKVLIGLMFFFTPLFVIKLSGIFPGYVFLAIEIIVLLGLEYYKNGKKRIKNLKTLIFPNKP